MNCKTQFLPGVHLIRVAVVVVVFTSLFSASFNTFPTVHTAVRAASPFLATCSPPCTENFDGVSIPALPSGWTTTLATGQAGDLPWRTVSTARVSLPNSAFAGGPDHVSDNLLVSKTFEMVSSPASAPAVLSFSRRINLETRFDGMVLEISIDGAPFVDITTAGGSFISNGYNATIVVSSSPIFERFAWTGDTSDFVTTSVKLPTSASLRSFTFRWRVVTDHSVGSVGAFIDNVILTEPPPNDNLRNAQQILGASGVIHGTNAGATKENDEPPHAGKPPVASVWYRWQAPNSGRFTFTTFNRINSESHLNTVLAVYTGNTIDGVQPFVSNDDDTLIDSTSTGGLFGGPACRDAKFSSRVSFDAVGGTIYHIAVDSIGATGNIVLRWGRSATISGRISFADGRKIGPEVLRLIGDTCQIRGSSPDPFDSYRFIDVPTGGNYEVLVDFPSINSFNFAQWGTTVGTSPLTASVTNYNFYLATPASSVSGRVMMPGNDANGVRVTCVSTGPIAFGAIPGIVSKVADVTATGDYSCSSLPNNADYVVTPSKAGFNFSPASSTVHVEGPVANVNFGGTATRTISGRITHPNGGIGVSGFSVALSGTQSASSVTDADGRYSFQGLPGGGNYTVTPSNANATFTPTSRSFNNLSADQTDANFTASFLLQLVLDQLGQVAAVDSVLLLRDPFPVINNANLLNRGVDRNTRVAIFLSNFQLGPTEPPSSVVINLVGSNSQSYDIPAEDVRSLPDGLTRVTFRLPDTLTVGTCTLLVKARGLTSNIGALRIRN